MPTLIEKCHLLDGDDRIITLGKDLSGSSKRTIIIDKKDGTYKLTITTKGAGSEEYDLGPKIPPDTNAMLETKEKSPAHGQ